jgi:hypothetical protein
MYGKQTCFNEGVWTDYKYAVYVSHIQQLNNRLQMYKELKALMIRISNDLTVQLLNNNTEYALENCND